MTLQNSQCKMLRSAQHDSSSVILHFAFCQVLQWRFSPSQELIYSDYAIIFLNTKGDTHVHENHQPCPSHYWCCSTGIIPFCRPDRDRLVPWNAFITDRWNLDRCCPACAGSLFPLYQSHPEEVGFPASTVII